MVLSQSIPNNGR